MGTALQGQVAGVNITAESGAPGESSSILIRGISSVTGSNTPLYVVDGVPQQGDPRLSSNEIETIDVLKDAASCAIYGTRGAAGVILITTKQGKEGKMKVNFSGTYGVQQLRNAIPLMNANEQTYFDILDKRNRTGAYDEDIRLEINRRPILYKNDTDLRDYIFRDGIVGTQNYSLNLSGGQKGTTYSVMAGYYDTEGILVNTGFQRFNTRANINYKYKRLSIGANLNMSVEDKAVGSPSVIGQSLKYSPMQDPIIAGNTDPIISEQGSFSNQINWVAGLMNIQDDWRTVNVASSFNLGYDFLPSLNLTTRFSLGESNTYQEYFKPYQEMYTSDGELLSRPNQSSVQRASGSSSSMTWDATLNFKKKLGDHSFNAVGVVSTEKYTNIGFTASKAGIIDNDLNSFNSATINPNVLARLRWSTDNKTAIFGALARVLYDYKSRYMISASVRADGSSRFSKANRWGIFPSVSGAWNISDEAFWGPLSNTVNNFKLRASYGTTGNQNFDAYSYENVVNYGYDAAFGNTGKENINYGATQISFANPNIKWETTIQNNIGVDLGFLKNKITLTAEYYNTRKKDMLFRVPLPSSAGIVGGASMIMNAGNMTNSGFEIALNHKNTVRKLYYQVGATFSTNNNVITSMPNNDTFTLTTDYGLEGDAITVLAEGYEAGAYFLYKTDGVINTQAKLAEYRKIQPAAQMGDLMYRDIAGNKDGTPDGKITEADRTYCGSGLPEFEMGLTTNLMYKGFDFYMLWYSAIGHEIMNGAKMITYANGRHKNLVSQWSENNPTSPIPAYRGDNKLHDNYKGYTDLWLEDGSYLRLKSVTLGYTLPNAVMQKKGISKMRFYLSAQNVFTLTRYSGYNPEIGGTVISRGLDKATYPASVVYTVGLNLSF